MRNLDLQGAERLKNAAEEYVKKRIEHLEVMRD